MRAQDINPTPILLCLLAGTVMAFVYTSKPKPSVPKVLAATNGLPFASNFMMYVYGAQAEIARHKKEATNEAERAAWDQVERRVSRQDWELVAQMLSRSSFRTNTMLGPSQLTISTNKPSTNSP